MPARCPHTRSRRRRRLLRPQPRSPSHCAPLTHSARLQAWAERQVDVATQPPTPLAPPPKVDVNNMRRVPEMPSRRKVPHNRSGAMPHIPPGATRALTGDGPAAKGRGGGAKSFFITATDAGGAEAEDAALLDARAQVR